MLAEDARWAADVIKSGSQSPGLRSYIALLLGHHFVRIAHEGALTLRSPDTHVGIPKLAGLLRDEFAAVIARMRHVSKLLDNRKRTFEMVVGDFEEILADRRAEYLGRSVFWARRFETDFGLYLVNGSLVGATIPAAYRLGLRTTREVTDESGLRAMSEEVGGTLRLLSSAAGDLSAPSATLNLKSIAPISSRDSRADRYFRNRFELSFPPGLKMLLIAIEGEMNALSILAPHTAAGHESAVFRACTVSVFHSLSTLGRIAKLNSDLNTSGMRGLRNLMKEKPVQRLLSSEGREVRNRCMHYEIKDPRIVIDTTRPMYGIIEFVCSGISRSGFAKDVDSATTLVADFLGSWAPKR